jgi:hypothetical protein
MDLKYKNVILPIQTLNERYCSPSCAHFVWNAFASLHCCSLLGGMGSGGAGTALKFSKNSNVYFRSKACMLKEIKSKRGK